MTSGGKILREVLTRPQRMKLDVAEDRDFYSSPRIVKHVDNRFLTGVTELYRQRIPPGSAVLDLMSSWVSHLPSEVKYGRVVGHGMNAAELGRNPQLTEFFVRDLNKQPSGWALADRSMDAVVCCVSVQYMQQPEQVFSEIYRVLRPGGVCIITFSNRMFHSKAIAAWRNANDYGHCGLVKQYFGAIEGFTTPEVLTAAPKPRPNSLHIHEQPPSTSTSPAAAQSTASVGTEVNDAFSSKRSTGALLLGDLTSAFSNAVDYVLNGGNTDPFYAVIAYRDYKAKGCCSGKYT